MDLAQALADNFSDKEINKMVLSAVLAEVMEFVRYSDPWIQLSLKHNRCFYCEATYETSKDDRDRDTKHKNNCIWETVRGLDELLSPTYND